MAKMLKIRVRQDIEVGFFQGTPAEGKTPVLANNAGWDWIYKEDTYTISPRNIMNADRASIGLVGWRQKELFDCVSSPKEILTFFRDIVAKGRHNKECLVQLAYWATQRMSHRLLQDRLLAIILN